MNYVIRRKEKRDCKDVAHIVTVAWNQTYKGIVSDAFLSNLYKNEIERAEKAFNSFTTDHNHQFVLEVDGKVVGFINVGLSSDKAYEKCGEIYALYIIDAYKGNGYGKKLFNTGIKELKDMQCDKMIIGCLQENKSNEFYEHMGGIFVKTRMFEKLNLIENVYLFENI